MAQFSIGDKVRSNRTGKTFSVATFSDRYRNIAISYVADNASDFELILKGDD